MAAENFEILWLQDARKTHFSAFSMIWATFCTYINHCYLYVLFISQPQSTNFEQKLIEEVASLYWLDFRSGRSILIDLSVSNCSCSLAKKDANLRPVAQRLMSYSRENWSAFMRLKFQQDNLVFKGLI